ncbi:cytochrome P450 [Ktedonosporobacter rubrisoli]|uniref:cytochrome P450 n=1 Tax=Ktedonosporobacter rubrisoli TaxID=2509675 RepID=UPI0013EE5156|nr:cytochrome P450 [Ktedonosporobacter rubrisoli]
MTSQRPPLGASFDPVHTQVELPYTFYARIRQEEPITFNPELNAYLVSRYDDIRSILSQPEYFSSKEALDFPVKFHEQTLAELRKGYQFVTATINSDGARHKRQRAPFQKAFAPARIKSMEPLIQEVAIRLANAFREDGRVEIISQFAYPLPLEIILTLVGVPLQDLEMIKARSDAARLLLSLTLPLEQQVDCARQFVELQHYYAQLLEERRKKPAQDLISDLISSGEEGEEQPSLPELIRQIMGVVVAGHETTTHLIGSGLIVLLEQPERWQELCAHPEYIPVAIEEILRLRGPVQGFFRTTTQQVTVGGQRLPAGTRLFLLYASANRDEERFPQAEHYIGNRQPNHHLAFGHGVHFCVGAPLARLEGRIAFETLTHYFPNLRLVPDQRFFYTFNLTTYGCQQIYLTWN